MDEGGEEGCTGHVEALFSMRAVLMDMVLLSKEPHPLICYKQWVGVVVTPYDH